MSLDQSTETVVVRLSLVEPADGRLFGSCSEVLLHVRHVPSELRSLPWAEPQVTREHHKEAIGALSAALKSGEPIRFGIMGSGVTSADAPCSFISRGLRLHQEQPGVSAVYSYYEPV